MQNLPETFWGRLSRSFTAWYRCLERPQFAQQTVIILLAMHSGLLAYSAYVHSPTLNEPGHLVAGLSHWKFGRFELYRVNPPLVRMVAALPVIAVGYEEDWSGFHEGPGARPVFDMGEDFVAANGERSFFLFMIARWACVPFSWIGAITCYLWARDLYGRPAGVMACALWSISPNILGHASLITADIGGTALGVTACFAFWHWLKKPTWSQAALTGAVLGLAELAKMTLILFYALWPLLWVAYRWPDRRALRLSGWTRQAAMLLLQLMIGLYILNIGYAFEGSCTQLKEFHFVSNLFTGRPENPPPLQGGAWGRSSTNSHTQDTKDYSPQPINKESRTRASQLATHNSHNRFKHAWLANLPVPFPKNYLLGVDIQQEDFEDYGRPSYLRGQWQEHGWWYYYLYAALIKVPLALWAIAILLLGFRLFQLCPFHSDIPQFTMRNPQRQDTLVLLSPAIVIFCVVSSKTGFSEHFRYVLPCFPFFFVWLSGFASVKLLVTLKKAITSENLLDTNVNGDIEEIFAQTSNSRTQDELVPFAVANLLLWTLTSSLWIYPHSLSYFNESIGGPLNGPKHLAGSNVDWGQDLMYMREWVDSHPNSQPVHFAVIASFDPSVLGITQMLPVDAASTELPDGPEAGWYIFSNSIVHGSEVYGRDGSGAHKRVDKRVSAYFRKLRRESSVGLSISVFRVPVLRASY